MCSFESRQIFEMSSHCNHRLHPWSIQMMNLRETIGGWVERTSPDPGGYPGEDWSVEQIRRGKLGMLLAIISFVKCWCSFIHWHWTESNFSAPGSLTWCLKSLDFWADASTCWSSQTRTFSFDLFCHLSLLFVVAVVVFCLWSCSDSWSCCCCCCGCCFFCCCCCCCYLYC